VHHITFSEGWSAGLHQAFDILLAVTQTRL